MYHYLSTLAVSLLACTPLFLGMNYIIPDLITQRQMLCLLAVFLFIYYSGALLTVSLRHGRLCRVLRQMRLPRGLTFSVFLSLAVFYCCCIHYQCPAAFIFICSILFIVLFILTGAVILSRQHHISTLQDYTDELEHAYNRLRTDRHDYQNILFSLYSYIEDKDCDSLMEYFRNHIYPAADSIPMADSLLSQLIYIKCRELKSIIYIKAADALNKSVRVTLNIPAAIDRLFMDPCDLIRIVGIFLDNAIEAAIDSDNPFLLITMIAHDTNLEITICNSCKEDTMTLDTLFQLGTSSKDPSRGIGLYSTRTLLFKYRNASLTTQCTDHVFTQNLHIFQNSLCC